MLDPVVPLRYAEALLDAVQGAGSLAEAEEDLRWLGELVAEPSVAALLENPTVEPRELRRLFVEPVSAQLRSPLVRNAIALLVDRRRAGVIPRLPAAFRRLALGQRGEAEGILESSRALGPEPVREIEAEVSAVLGQKVHLTVREAPELVGGFRATVGSKRFDWSVSSRLADLRERMLSARLAP